MLEVKETARGWRWSVTTPKGKATSSLYYTTKRAALLGGRRFCAAAAGGQVEIHGRKRSSGWTVDLLNNRPRPPAVAARLNDRYVTRRQSKKAALTVVAAAVEVFNALA